ncbi:MAG TPA: hypothetical protein VGR47_22100 [Terracidiphilus sp.]|nr:hypothetical protein [Terracidiphilus sp.]
MRPKTIGRALGIGVRVAGRVAGERLAAHAQNGGQIQPPQAVPSTGPATRAAGQSAGRASRGLARGLSGFFRPFARVGHALWLEVAGVFFLVPVLIFGSYMWRIRANWNHGPDHRYFLISCVVVAMFLYLSITSFWRASRK